MNGTRQQIQYSLALEQADQGEAPVSGHQRTEPFVAKPAPESSAVTEQLMEEVCNRENLVRAWKRVRQNKGGPGVDGMTIDDAKDYLREHWPSIRSQLLAGTYQPQPVKRPRCCPGTWPPIRGSNWREQHRRNVPRGRSTPARHGKHCLSAVCPNMHEQAMSQLQTSNQSPATCHCGISAISASQISSVDQIFFGFFRDRPPLSQSPVIRRPLRWRASAHPTRQSRRQPRPNQWPIGIVFSNRTKRARPAIQNRFMMPPKNSRPIRNQQQPRQ